MIRLDRIAECNRVLFEALLTEAVRARKVGDFEESLRWCSVAAWFASGKGWFGELSSPKLESELLEAANALPQPRRQSRPNARPRWLHVMTEAYATLGHSNLCRRWIQLDREAAHDVVLLNQRKNAPANLAATVKEAGGECLVLDRSAGLLERAAELREYAWRNADVVVLHTHPDDVTGVVAFGIEGGPPVLVENHADHVFWVGCSIADLVLDIRPSGNRWTTEARGVPRALILPIPLQLETESPPVSLTADQKRDLRRELGLPDRGVMMLTVGSPAKYQPLLHLNFLKTAQQILRECPEAFVAAVGPENQGDWKEAAKASGGRIVALGRQLDSTRYCQAADIYLEGFPLGSLTALLEAGLAGLPCVRGPGESIPPFTSDSLSLNGFAQPTNVADYQQQAVELAKNPHTWAAVGGRLRDAISAQHCAKGWKSFLQEVKKNTPANHRLFPAFHSRPVEHDLRNWFLRFSYPDGQMPSCQALVEPLWLEAWKRTNGAPQLEGRLWAALKARQAEQPIPSRKWTESVRLWRLNRRLKRRGLRLRWIARGEAALNSGKRSLARALTYRCLLAGFSCLTDVMWFKLWLKAHLGAILERRARS